METQTEHNKENGLIQTNIIIPKGFFKAYKKRKDYPKIKKIIQKIKEEEHTNEQEQKTIIGKCECCVKRKTLNKFKWLDNKTLLCYDCADRLGKSTIWKSKGIVETIRLTRISFRLERAMNEVLK